MIVGVGTDICDVERIAEALARQGDRFRRRICSDREQQLMAAYAKQASLYAGCFAAKEACAKALGTGITERVRWTHIEVLAGVRGQSVLYLSGGAQRRARHLARRGNFRAHLSITYNGAFAMAFVVLEVE